MDELARSYAEPANYVSKWIVCRESSQVGFTHFHTLENNAAYVTIGKSRDASTGTGVFIACLSIHLMRKENYSAAYCHIRARNAASKKIASRFGFVETIDVLPQYNHLTNVPLYRLSLLETNPAVESFGNQICFPL